MAENPRTIEPFSMPRKFIVPDDLLPNQVNTRDPPDVLWLHVTCMFKHLDIFSLFQTAGLKHSGSNRTRRLMEKVLRWQKTTM